MPAREPWEQMHDVLAAQITHARAEAPRVDPAGDTGCTECGLPIGDKARWYSNGTGALSPYCKACAEIEFPVL